MQSGLIAKVHGSFVDISESNFPIIKPNGLKRSLQVHDRSENKSGDIILKGIVADESRKNEENTNISDDGEIQEGVKNSFTRTKSSKFAAIPGEFVVIENSDADFAFDLIGKTTETMVAPIKFDLNAIASDYDEGGSNIWMTGFYNYDGNANTGVAYGDNVLSDTDIGPIFTNSRMNQLGITTAWAEEEMKFMITESGYLRIYTPSDFGTPSFIRFVKEFINQYAIDDMGD